MKQQRLMQLKKKEDAVMEQQLIRHKYREEQNKADLDEIAKKEVQIRLLQAELDKAFAALDKDETQIRRDQQALIQKYYPHEETSHSENSSPLSSSPVDEFKPKNKNLLQLGRTKRGSVLLKREVVTEFDNPLIRVKQTKSASDERTSPNSSEHQLTSTVSASNITPLRNDFYEAKRAHSVEDLMRQRENLSESNSTMENLSDSMEETKTLSEEELHAEFEEKFKIIRNRQIDHVIARQAFNNRKEKFDQLVARLEERKRQIESKSNNDTSEENTSTILKAIKQDQIETLQQLREYHRNEANILNHSESLKHQLGAYRDFLRNQVSTNAKLAPSVAKMSHTHSLSHTEALRERILPVLQNFSSSIKLLLENISKMPEQSSQSNDCSTVNIWDEPQISTGKEKNVIFSTDNEQEERAQIKAGTLNQLVMRLTDEKRHDLNFLKTFITTFQSFTTRELFFQKLEERYNVPQEKHADIPEEQWKQNIVLPIQVRVYNVIKLWLDTRFPDFDYTLMKRLNAFMDSKFRKDGHSNFANTLSSIIRRKISQEVNNNNNNTVVLPPPRNNKAIHKMGINIDDILLNTSPEMIAKNLTAIDAKLYQSIQPVELLNGAWTKPKLKHRAKNVLALIDRFNAVSNWTAYVICCAKRLRIRQLLYTRFIAIAEALREMNNFNTLLAIVAGINSTAVHRLKFTQEGVPPRSLEIFQELHALMNSTNSYKNYRDAIHSVAPPLVPYLGTYLTDLVFIDDGNPDTIDGLINFRKREMIYRVIEEIQQYQQAPYHIEVEPHLQSAFCQLEFVEEDELYQISFEREPKTCKDKSELLQ